MPHYCNKTSCASNLEDFLEEKLENITILGKAETVNERITVKGFKFYALRNKPLNHIKAFKKSNTEP